MIKSRLNHIRIVLPFVGMLAAAACDPEDKLTPVDHKTAALSAETNLKNIADNLASATAFVAESDAIAETLAQLQSCDDGEDAASEPGVACDPAVDLGCGDPAPPVVVEPTCGPEAIKADLRELNQDMDELMDDLVARLRSDIFVEANIESQSETEIVYRLPANVLCDMVDDSDCLMEHTKAEPRIKVTAPAVGDVDLALLMTAQKFQPMVFHVYRDRLGVSVDLGQVRSAMVAIDPQEAQEIQALSGATKLMLVKNGAQDFSLIASIDKAVDMSMLQEGKLAQMHVDTGDYELRLDAAQKTITASMDMGALSVKLPLEDLGDIVEAMPNMAMMKATDMFELVLGGLNGSFTFDGNRDTLAFKGLGLGDRSTGISVNGNEIFGIDVNKSQGRRFDLTVTAAQSNAPLFAFAPGFDLELRVKFKSLADRFSDLPAWALDEMIRFTLSGQNPTIQEASNGVKVVSGSLAITSQSQPQANVSVAAGQCLVENPSPPAGGHELLSAFASGACQ